MRSILLSALAALMCELAAVGAEDAKPVMGLSTETWDFGTLEQGQTATTEVEVSNKGNADLKITFIRSSCAACVGNASGASQVKPGGTGKITLSFYSKGLLGQQGKVVYVHGNDPVTPYKAVRIIGTVKRTPRPEILVTPEVLDVGLVRKGEGVVRTLVVENKGEVPLSISSASGSEACQVRLPDKPSIEPGKKLDLPVSLAGDKLNGLIQEYLTIQSNDPIAPSKTITLVGYAAAPGQASAPARGVTVSPVGEPVKVPGTGGAVYRSYQLANHLPAKVTVSVAIGEKALQKVELAPGQTTEVEVFRDLISTELSEKAVLEFKVGFAAVLPAR